MPEGDTIYRTAATLRKVLLEKTITRFDTSLLSVEAVVRRSPVAGRRVTAIEPRGKHLLITFALPESADGEEDPERGATVPEALVLHTHMRMTGSWHVYRPGETWQKPAAYAKVVLYTDDFVVPCFSAPVVELLTEWQAKRLPDLVSLGPDAITPEFDEEEAFRRLRSRPELPIGVALLNQRAMAGVGNIFKSEVLFVRRVSPFLRVRELPDETLRSLGSESHRLLQLNRQGGERRTVFGLSERNRLWVYGRSGEPCRVCGTRIQMRRQGIDARSTYFCPDCQASGPDNPDR